MLWHLDYGGKSGSGIGAGNMMMETDLTTEQEKSCSEHSCVVTYKNMEVDLIYVFQYHSNNFNLSFDFVCSQDAPTLFFFSWKT